MSRDHWDAILASAPLNATAGAVTGKGYHYEPENMQRGHCWDDQPEILPLSDAVFLQPQFINLTGRKLGRLAVLGILAAEDTASQRKSKGALWVCRCVCGRYQGVRGKTIKDERRDRCDYCEHTAQLVIAASGNNARIRAESPEAKKW